MHSMCVSCGTDVGYMPDEGVTVQCATCTLMLCAGLEADEVRRLKAVDTDTVRAVRTEKGWSQEDLSLYLKLPKSTVGRFERGLILCPRELADWLDLAS